MDEAEVCIPIPGYPAYTRCSSARFCRVMRWECRKKNHVAICNMFNQSKRREYKVRLIRADHRDLEPTVLVRAPRPNDHRQMEKLLPWFTPLLVYRLDGEDWVRWQVPHAVAEDLGISSGCICCGTGALAVDNGFHVDTAWSETDWWLTENGYELPTYGVADCNTTPQEEGKKK